MGRRAALYFAASGEIRHRRGPPPVLIEMLMSAGGEGCAGRVPPSISKVEIGYARRETR